MFIKFIITKYVKKIHYMLLLNSVYSFAVKNNDKEIDCMTTKKEFYKNYLEKLNEFKNINWVKNYLELKEKPNFWTIIEYGEEVRLNKKSAHEIRYSKMVRWLLDPNENHQLGNIFAHKIMTLIGVDYSYNANKNESIKVTTEALEDIDIFYKDPSQNICIAIELKQFAKEHQSTGYDSQLDKYEHVVGEFVEKSKNTMKPYYIYLTTLQEDPSNDNWFAIGYQQLIEIIEEVSEAYLSNSDYVYRKDTLKIITDFKDDLQRSKDLAEKNMNGIKNIFSLEEQDFSVSLANEMNREIESTHFDELVELYNGNDQTLKELITMIDEILTIQDHTPNEPVKLLLRKIYNYLSGDRELDTINVQEYKAKETLTSIKQELINHYDLNFDTIALTGGKGQGINIYHKDNTYRIYLSGDTHGHFPNDHINLLPIPNIEKTKVYADYVSNRQFNLNDNAIYKDEISHKEGQTITFDQLMANHVMLAIKELNDMLIEGKAF